MEPAAGMSGRSARIVVHLASARPRLLVPPRVAPRVDSRGRSASVAQAMPSRHFALYGLLAEERHARATDSWTRRTGGGDRLEAPRLGALPGRAPRTIVPRLRRRAPRRARHRV